MICLYCTVKGKSTTPASDEELTDLLRKTEISFFRLVADVSIVLLREKSQTLGEVEKKFHVPVNFPDLPNE